MQDNIIGILGGLLVGITLAVTGGGGSMVAVPVLTVGLRLPIAAAAPVSLIIVGIAAIAGWWEAARKGELHWKAVGRFLLAALPMLILSRRGASYLPDALLSGGFGLLALWVAVYPPQTKTDHAPISSLRFGLIAGATGAMAGLFGAGGGFLITPALALGARLELGAAIPNALVVITVFGITGILSSLEQMSLSGMGGPPLLMLSVAVVTGWAGARWRSRLAPETVRTAFRLVVGMAALVMLARAFFGVYYPK